MVQVFPAKIRYYVMVFGNTMDSHKTFMDHLAISSELHEVNSESDSDVIIAFVPIVSRVGTDISAAMEKIPHDKPVVLVVLHHTFNEDYIAPDSSRIVNQDNVFPVDCLFYEDQGLLRCHRNDKAISAVKQHLRMKNQPEKVATLLTPHNDDTSGTKRSHQIRGDHSECILCMSEGGPDYQHYFCGLRGLQWICVVALISFVIILLIILGVFLM